MFRKFTRSEKTEVLTPQQHDAVQTELSKLGKTSAQNLTDEERKNLGEALDKHQ